MEVRIYGRDLYRKGQIENQTSLIWTRKFYEPGTFELHAPITDENLYLLQKDNIIGKKGSAEAGIIEDIEKEESDIKNEITVKGRFLSSYMDRRLIKKTVNFSGKTEVAMRQLYSGVVPLPLVELGNLNGFPESVEFQVTMKNLLTYESKLSRAGAIGFRFRPDFRERKIVFETYQGKDRTFNQHENNRVIFSESYNNLNNAIYRYNNQNLKTFAIVGGQGEGDARTYYELGGGEGYDLREIFVDAKDINPDGLTAAQYKAALLQRAQEALNDAIASETLESETDAAINFVYKEDYDLGDIVTVRKKKWNLYMNQRITELSEVYEYGGMTVVPTFGDPLPEKIKWDE
jgi:hypothetical protein|nr:MAG TPA: hypothetical protein [Caudoviricetes sp.]